MDQQGKAGNPARRGQLNKGKNAFFPVPVPAWKLATRDRFGRSIPCQPARCPHSGCSKHEMERQDKPGGKLLSVE